MVNLFATICAGSAEAAARSEATAPKGISLCIFRVSPRLPEEVSYAPISISRSGARTRACRFEAPLDARKLRAWLAGVRILAAGAAVPTTRINGQSAVFVLPADAGGGFYPLTAVLT
jgi:hypothetical protein